MDASSLRWFDEQGYVRQCGFVRRWIAREKRRDYFMDEGLIAQSAKQYNSNGRFLWTRPAYGGSMNKVMSDSAVLYDAG